MDEKFKQSLEQLHAELEQTHSIDPDTRDLLQHLMKDIQLTLRDGSVTPPLRDSTLGKRLADSLKGLEESHPSLVLTIGRVLDHLAQV